LAIQIADVDSKVDRGYEHLHSLHQETLDFINRYPFGLQQVKDGNGARYTGIVHIYREPDNARFGLLIGDCANNFRCALDYLVHSVARGTVAAATLNQYEHRYAFPICTSQHAWDEALRGHRLEGLSPAVIAEIESRQPFRTHPQQPDQAPLAALLWLSDRDKHELLHTVAGYVQAAQVHFEPALTPGTFQLHVPPGPHTVTGTTVLDLHLAPAIPDLQIKLDMVLEIRVRDCPIAEDVRELLLKIGQMSQRVIAQVVRAAQPPAPAAAPGAPGPTTP
jgi:hypothetical protein